MPRVRCITLAEIENYPEELEQNDDVDDVSTIKRDMESENIFPTCSSENIPCRKKKKTPDCRAKCHPKQYATS
jgi:hypothetical protein